MSATDTTVITDAVNSLTIAGPTTLTVNTDTGEILDETITTAEPIRVIETTVHALKPSSDALFDTRSFIDVPVMDGQATDELVVAFSGSIKYAAADPAGQEMFAKLTLGKSVDLRVSGVVAGKAGGWKLAGVGTDSEREVVTGKLTVKVTDLFSLAPEDL